MEKVEKSRKTFTRESHREVKICLFLFSLFLILISSTATHPAAFTEYAITQGYYSEFQDLAAAVAQEFGPNAEVADWETIKLEFMGQIDTFCDHVGLLNYRDSALCYRNGQAWWFGVRHYFVERHDGNVPDGWLVHDQIDNNTLDLGSWSSLYMPILVKLDLPVPDIKVNGSDGPLTLYPGDPLEVTASLNAGSYRGQNGELWIAAIRTSNLNKWWYTRPTWVQSATPLPAHQGPLPNVPPQTILNTVVPMDADGKYQFYIVADVNMDGIPDMDRFHLRTGIWQCG